MAPSRPRVADSVAVLDVDGEAVVYDHDSGSQVHYLNHSAALVLDLCDGSATVKQMAQAIADVYETPVSEVEPQVRDVVKNLSKLGVLVSSRRSSPAGANADGASDATANGDADQRRIVRMEVPRTS